MNIAQFTFTVRSGRAKTTQIVAGSGELTVNSTLLEAANDAVMNESHDESYYRQQNLKKQELCFFERPISMKMRSLYNWKNAADYSRVQDKKSTEMSGGVQTYMEILLKVESTDDEITTPITVL